MTTKKLSKYTSGSDLLFYILVDIFIGVIMLLVLYPLIYVLSCSFSAPSAVLEAKIILFPVDFSLEGYRTVFRNKDIFTGYYNSARYMIIGTIVNVSATMIAAYPLSQKEMPFRKTCMFLFTFTMFFSGGLIPNYMLMQKLRLIDTTAVMIIPGAIAVWNLIITRTFLQHNIPTELLEAAFIDGCSHVRYFFSMVIPLSKAVIAVIALYYAVGHWNSYFDAFIYLNSRNRYPLQLFLREILIANIIDPDLMVDEELMQNRQGLADLLKYSLIVVSTVPMLVIYPFAQKYFIKGVMIGSLKG